MAYRNASLISTVTEGMRQRIIAKGIPPAKVVVVPPPADGNLFHVGTPAESHTFRSKHSLEGKFIVAHSGNMGVKQGLDVVLDAAAILKEQRDCVFLLAGDGAMRSSLENRAALLKLANVRFLPLQEHAEFPHMLAAIDIALIVQLASVSDIAFPSKTVTLLSAARPIGAAVNDSSEIASVIRESGGGMVTRPEKPDSLAETILEVFNNREKGRTMGECGRRYALQHWNAAHILPAFEAYLSRVSGAGQRFEERAKVAWPEPPQRSAEQSPRAVALLDASTTEKL
jgi:colanic acid biosynthesis glycosyl transferase WcaI